MARLRGMVAWLAGMALLLLAAATFALWLWPEGEGPAPGGVAAPAQAIPLAVLGDSNSQSYDGAASEGAGRWPSWQWPQVLARLRGQTVDLGPWVDWGRPGWVAWAREWLGQSPGRAPRKADYLYNFANGGASCRHLMGERWGQRFRQAPRLVALMDRDPARWARGIVVIRIGHNDWAGTLDVQARDPQAPELAEVTRYCAAQVEATIRLIRARHAGTRIVVVGVMSEADDPGQFERFRSGEQMAHIRAATATFNRALRQVTEGGAGMAFLDDAAWFRQHWGGRAPDGAPAYRAATLGAWQITNTAGPALTDGLRQDHHAGLAWNALWTQALVALLRERLGVSIAPVEDEELVRWLQARQAPLSPTAPAGVVRVPGS